MYNVVIWTELSYNSKSLQARKIRHDFTVKSYFVYSISIAFINSTVKYRDLGGTGTVKIGYRSSGIPRYREYCQSLVIMGMITALNI